VINFKRIFCLVPHHFLIEYLSASEKSSCILDLVLQHMKASEIQAKIRWNCIIAIVNRESIMYCTAFEPCLRFLVQLFHVITPTKARVDIMVDNFNGLLQDFNVLILECFESGINVSINTVCARCSDTT
jgi:hypothetical protein